jgi:hypothetical protein
LWVLCDFHLELFDKILSVISWLSYGIISDYWTTRWNYLWLLDYHMELSVITILSYGIISDYWTPDGIICDYRTIIWNYLWLPDYHMELSVITGLSYAIICDYLTDMEISVITWLIWNYLWLLDWYGIICDYHTIIWNYLWLIDYHMKLFVITWLLYSRFCECWILEEFVITWLSDNIIYGYLITM